MTELIRTIFPRCDADVVITNIFKVFDTGGTGKVVPNELLMAFSMSMQGTVADKLHWTFKLYDKDGSGEIDPEEMEEIFTKEKVKI
ncbi:neurocalcin-like [Eurytemora carolleeae]|uniref:neurocalcin-like n=1 Tax=Eurytemora carolleeae TaxID=1294199 RepID=UPI000C776F6C|nr:neurocalcin-like [Eurytemora carolleeae]|eukprot:XP_023341118.1 neurocalcin-like [Eurytemora affinis]